MRRLVLIALAFFILANALDIWASWATPRFEETNPFVRDANHSFVLKRGIEVKAITGAALLILCCVSYLALTSFSRELGAFAFAAVLFYFAGDALLNAVVWNFLVWLGWYQP